MLHNKKSYMNKRNILNESFFKKIANFLKSIPKLSSEKKAKVSKKLKGQVSILNKSIDKYEASIKKELGDEYPDLPRFDIEDFLK